MKRLLIFFLITLGFIKSVNAQSIEMDAIRHALIDSIEYSLFQLPSKDSIVFEEKIKNIFLKSNEKKISIHATIDSLQTIYYNELQKGNKIRAIHWITLGSYYEQNNNFNDNFKILTTLYRNVESPQFTPQEKMEIMSTYANDQYRSGNIKNAEHVYGRLLKISLEQNSQFGIFNSIMPLLKIVTVKGKYQESLQLLETAKKFISSQPDSIERMHMQTFINFSLGEAFYWQGMNGVAENIYLRFLNLEAHKKPGNSEYVTLITMICLADICSERGDFTSAEKYLNDVENDKNAQIVFEIDEFVARLEYVKGRVLRRQKNYEKAWVAFDKSISISKEGYPALLPPLAMERANIWMNTDEAFHKKHPFNVKDALQTSQAWLDSAGILNGLANIHFLWAAWYARNNDAQNSFFHTRQYRRYVEQFAINENNAAAADWEIKFVGEMQGKNVIRLENDNKNLVINQDRQRFGLIILGLLGFFAFMRYRAKNEVAKHLKEKNKIIQDAQIQTETLLLNILPRSIAAELQKNGFVAPQKYANVTILFSDIENFSKIAERLTAEQLVQELDTCYRGFDEIIAKFGLEKIKTIGDSYMCVGGLNCSPQEGAQNVIYAALEMCTFLENSNSPFQRMRFGVHTGEVVAGVVGKIKFAYDVFGDAVNIAARMETAGLPHRVNISSSTGALVENVFSLESRGKLTTKNKGDMDMFFVKEYRLPKL
jgi:class 3 adenylate cyclase